ncbi:Lrp/AsnC family transcriptional regulator [Sneathiella chinensis]|uniref:AsnC family transcriptional regulator n=1 Tax=Sneathiella chinensis TaxID=349750 RepID=A0ABQ5U0J2_9PROT|nr:Lrp/AsnC family transcriptional regulator [Sneathiella chinensis]GLQ04824.1 AsnC family transcriptional regulator [Sneathiella chinensis]
MLKLDDRDLKILAILQREGRISKAALAERIALSPTPCWERLKRLENAGIIEGYGARIALGSLGPMSVIFMQAELESHKSEDFERFEAAVRDIPEIVECWAIGGGLDYLLKVATRDVDSYQRLVDRILNMQIGLCRYYTYIVTKPVKVSPFPPIPASLDP